MRMAIRSALLAFVLLLAVGHNGAAAADLKVLTAGAMRGVLEALLPQFERDLGHRVVVDSATAGGLGKRIEGGEAFDVAIITPSVIDELSNKGKIGSPRVDLAKVGMGVAVKAGTAAPDIATVEAFKQALIAAKSVAYIDPAAGGSSGIYFDQLIERLGIGDEVRAKARLKRGGYVADLVASGEAELAVHQISEIVPVKGVTLVGPLPAPVQNFTVYTAAVGAASREPDAAKALVDHLAGPAALPVLQAKGMERP